MRKVVFLMRPRGTVAVDVCSTAKPRFGAFAVIRIDACNWKIVPARYSSRGPSGELLTETRAIDEEIGVESVGLLDAPDDVGGELAELGRE